MGRTVQIASAEPVIRRELAEQLQLAGYACVDEGAEFVLEDTGTALAMAGQEFARPLRLSALLATLARPGGRIALSGGWHFDGGERVLAHPQHRFVALTEKEAGLLSALLASGVRECARAELLERVWGYGEDISTHTLETHMYRLRAKLKKALAGECIETTAAGYRLAL